MDSISHSPDRKVNWRRHVASKPAAACKGRHSHCQSRQPRHDVVKPISMVFRLPVSVSISFLLFPLLLNLFTRLPLFHIVGFFVHVNVLPV